MKLSIMRSAKVPADKSVPTSLDEARPGKRLKHKNGPDGEVFPKKARGLNRMGGYVNNDLVHGDMHRREPVHGTNLDGDEQPLPRAQERHTTNSAAATDASRGMVPKSCHRVFEAGRTTHAPLPETQSL